MVPSACPTVSTQLNGAPPSAGFPGFTCDTTIRTEPSAPYSAVCLFTWTGKYLGFSSVAVPRSQLIKWIWFENLWDRASKLSRGTVGVGVRTCGSTDAQRAIGVEGGTKSRLPVIQRLHPIVVELKVPRGTLWRCSLDHQRLVWPERPVRVVVSDRRVTAHCV
jgi:hypothetical protein